MSRRLSPAELADHLRVAAELRQDAERLRGAGRHGSAAFCEREAADLEQIAYGAGVYALRAEPEPPLPRSAVRDALRILKIGPFIVLAFWTVCAWLNGRI